MPAALYRGRRHTIYLAAPDWLTSGGKIKTTIMQAVLLDNRGLLRLSGEAAAPFLQGLVTADIGKLETTRAVYSCLLTPQGKFLFDFHLVKLPPQDGEAAILLETAAGRLAELERRLMLYRLRAPVGIETLEPAPAVALAFGEGIAERLGLTPEPGAVRHDDGPLRMVDPRLAAFGVRLHGEREALLAWLAGRGVEPATQAAFERHRIALAIPEAGQDLVVDKTIMLEAGLDRLNAVAFDKGCYVGQELTARTHYRGLVKRRLVPLRVTGGTAEPGTAILAGEREAGEIRSAAGDLALALLRLDRLGEPLTTDRHPVHPLPAFWQTDLEGMRGG